MKFDDLKTELLQRLLDQSPFIHFLQMRVERVDIPGERLVLSMPMSDTVERAAGSGQMHGGAIASLIDTAGCFALIMRTLQPVPTINFRVDYLRPAFGGPILADAAVRRAGKTVGVVDVDVTARDGKLLALGRGVFGV